MVGVTDIGGNVVYRFEYSTYGEIFEVNSDNELEEFTDFEEIVYGFQGRRLDSETNGLMYFRNRYYNPKLGRFMQRDPKGYIDSYGLYEAFAGNTYAYQDPLGTDILTLDFEPVGIEMRARKVALRNLAYRRELYQRKLLKKQLVSSGFKFRVVHEYGGTSRFDNIDLFKITGRANFTMGFLKEALKQHIKKSKRFEKIACEVTLDMLNFYDISDATPIELRPDIRKSEATGGILRLGANSEGGLKFGIFLHEIAHIYVHPYMVDALYMGTEDKYYMTLPSQLTELDKANPKNIEDFFTIFKKYKEYRYGIIKGVKWNSESIAEFATFLYFFSKMNRPQEFSVYSGRPTTATYENDLKDFKRIAKKLSVAFRKKK